MPKQAKGRIAERNYAKRIRSLKARRKKKTKGRAPWKQFFESGIGASIRTEIPKSSIHSIVYTYGKKLGKRFICSYDSRNGCTVVRIETIKSR